MQPSDPGLLRFSTEGLPEHQRLAVWREAFGRAVLKVDVAPLDEGPFRADLAMCALPGLGVSWGSNSAQHIERTRALVAEGDDDLFLVLVSSGSIAVDQSGRRLDIAAGGVGLWQGGETGIARCGAGFSHVTLKLTRRDLEAMVPEADRLVMRPFGPDPAALTLLKHTLGGLAHIAPAAGPELQKLVAAHLRDLLALALGARPEAADVARRRGLGAARLQAAKAFIRRHLARPDLAIHHVAANQQVSPRALQLLFEADGTTFSAFLLQERLALAHRLLTDPRVAERSIGAIALDSGFGDLSYFNRCFRRRYGATPSEVRAGGWTTGA
jgi:AraC-like DNA-binding protein